MCILSVNANPTYAYLNVGTYVNIQQTYAYLNLVRNTRTNIKGIAGTSLLALYVYLCMCVFMYSGSNYICI
jgi:hypothetical protein